MENRNGKKQVKESPMREQTEGKDERNREEMKRREDRISRGVKVIKRDASCPPEVHLQAASSTTTDTQ